MLTLKTLAPGIYTVVCPIRGTYRLVSTTRACARDALLRARTAPASDWLSNSALRVALVRLGFETDQSVEISLGDP